jgi:alpha-galactosidase
VKKSGIFVLCLIAVISAMTLNCTRSQPKPRTKEPPTRPSDIQVEIKTGGPLVLTTTGSAFEVGPSGYIQAFLQRDGKRLTLDDPRLGAPNESNYVVHNGADVHFILDFDQAKVLESIGKLGRGKHIEIPSHVLGNQSTAPANPSAGIQKILSVEVYDDFPNLLLSTVEYKNTGSADVTLDRVIEQRHRLNAKLADPRVAPFDMWSFQGSSYKWGQDDVFKLTRASTQPNAMGEAVKGGYGGGVPVLAFWTASVGEAIGHVETLPLTLSLPVRVDTDQRVDASIDIPAQTTLKPGESYSTPRSFVAVYHGDFYEPLRMWSSVLQKEGWNIPKPSNEAYNISWCGWGYEFNVTPAQMEGTIPKLKEMNIKWATLDDRWFDTYGDWNPRPETFPGDSIRTMADDFHKQNMLVQLWWLPLGAEDGEGKWESHKYIVSKVVKDHPDWLILDKEGKHGRMTRDLAALCPAVPQVQAYYKQLTEKFIRDWGYDGSKLDNIYSVPQCFNPAHHHKSPQDSVNAVADVYKIIFQSTRTIKPNSVTQSCPCGTPPSLAWLPYMDQAVTADPVGATQVRRRIKMYKALLGPDSAVYGDHVELSTMDRLGNDHWREHGEDFASTIGTGGVVGTKFVWPEIGEPKFKEVNLTGHKDEVWKKWISLYNQKMLSKGNFLDLYTYGYDLPEAYAIEKDGAMYYAFFAPEQNGSWKGEVELRGLKPGTYQVTDYTDGKSLGTVEAGIGKSPKLATGFKDHLLLEVTK